MFQLSKIENIKYMLKEFERKKLELQEQSVQKKAIEEFNGTVEFAEKS